MKAAVAALAGVLFALGLVLGGMTQPSKVVGFLDVTGTATGHWDPSLAFVMGGALLVHLPVVRWLRRRTRPLLSERFRWPTRGDVDVRLLAGSALFGVGWGLAGICPGPAVVALGALSTPFLWFMASMATGMLLFRGVERGMQRAIPSATTKEQRESPTQGAGCA
jgi:uncharacterized membrane protein YedE/YeeE